MKTSHFKYIGIDPGVGGGIASIDEDGKIKKPKEESKDNEADKCSTKKRNY